MLTLEENLPDDFKNNSKISIDGHIFTDSLVAMTSEKKSRNVLSVLFDGVSYGDYALIEEIPVRIRASTLLSTPLFGVFVTKNLNIDKQKLKELKKHEK